MPTTSEKKIWPRFVTALVVAAGIGVAWFVAAGWLGSLWSSNMGQSQRRYESIVATDRGELLVSSYEYEPVYRYTYRTLDGEQRKEPSTLWSASLSDKPRPRSIPVPDSWSYAMRWTFDQDQSQGGTTWFAVPDGEDRFHFEAYDLMSRTRVGYISRKGFSVARPAPVDRFDLDEGSIGGRVAGWSWRNDTYLSWSTSWEPQRGMVNPWIVYVIDGGKVLEVDPRKRTVRMLIGEGEAYSLSMANYPIGDAEDQTAALEAAGLDPSLVERRRICRGCVLVRYEDHVTAIELPSGEQSEFTIPEPLRNALYLPVKRLDADTLWLQTSHPRTRESELVTLLHADREGKILEEREVELATNRQPNEREVALGMAPLAPVPLGWAIATPLAAVSKSLYGMAPTFAAGLSQTLHNFWPALVIVAVAGLASAAYILRQQRRHRRSHTAAWTTLAFLAGPALAAAYWVEHRHAVTTACRSCKTLVPAKRDSCAACGTLFPEPPLTGVEVFAW